MKKRSLQKKKSPARRTLQAAFLLTLAVFLLPVAVFGTNARADSNTKMPQVSSSSGEESAQSAEQKTEEALTNKKTADTAVPDVGKTKSVTIKVQIGNKVEKMNLEEYLWGVVAAEMPASFEEEALQAQAIAARTYTLYRMENPSPNHPNADICTDPACCQAWISYQDRLTDWSNSTKKEYAKKITDAIEKTKGQVIYYQDKPIMAAFHAASAGITKSAEEVWGKNVAYLQAVKSPETGKQVPNYYSVATVTVAAFKSAVQQAYPKADLSGKPGKWFGKVGYDKGGLPETLQVGGVTVPTASLRSLFKLRSSSLTVECDGKKVTFYVTGYGHGVGMSQYGANALAKKGKSAKEILEHYYTGVEIRSMHS